MGDMKYCIVCEDIISENEEYEEFIAYDGYAETERPLFVCSICKVN